MSSNKTNYCCIDRSETEVNSNQGYQYSSKKGYCLKSRRQIHKSLHNMKLKCIKQFKLVKYIQAILGHHVKSIELWKRMNQGKGKIELLRSSIYVSSIDGCNLIK